VGANRQYFLYFIIVVLLSGIADRYLVYYYILYARIVIIINVNIIVLCMEKIAHLLGIGVAVHAGGQLHSTNKLKVLFVYLLLFIIFLLVGPEGL